MTTSAGEFVNAVSWLLGRNATVVSGPAAGAAAASGPAVRQGAPA